MIRSQWIYGFSLTVALTCIVGAETAWSADKPSTKSPQGIRAEGIRAQKGPATAVPSRTTSDIVPASFSSVADIQDSAIDECENLRDRARMRTSRIYRESMLARCHRYESEKIRLEHENCKDWFNYIRGYGPVVWVRNGPELKWHPPSIPFAKRVGGTTARHWEGVTDIPSQPDISPRRINQIHRSEMTYRSHE